MPNIDNFSSREERNEWYRKYKRKNIKRVRDSHKKYNKKWRKTEGVKTVNRKKAISRAMINNAIKKGK